MKSKANVLTIRSMGSSDVDVHSWQPDALADVYFPLELDIGEEGKDGGNLFQVLVATPEGLRHHSKETVILSERATLILSEYSWPLLDRALRQIVARCAAATWDESVANLQRYFSWEYEDYVPE